MSDIAPLLGYVPRGITVIDETYPIQHLFSDFLGYVYFGGGIMLLLPPILKS